MVQLNSNMQQIHKNLDEINFELGKYSVNLPAEEVTTLDILEQQLVDLTERVQSLTKLLGCHDEREGETIKHPTPPSSPDLTQRIEAKLSKLALPQDTTSTKKEDAREEETSVPRRPDDDLEKLQIRVGLPMDTTDFAKSKGHEKDLYLHRAVTFESKNTGNQSKTNTVKMNEARVLYQHNFGNKGPYGVGAVQVAIPVQSIETMLRNIADPVFIDRDDLDSIKLTQDGRDFHVYILDLSSTNVCLESTQDGTVSGGDFMSRLITAGYDVHASAVLATLFKYSGPELSNHLNAKFRLCFDLAEVTLKGHTGGQLDPDPFGPRKTATVQNSHPMSAGPAATTPRFHGRTLKAAC
ncbi:hypothetical protein A4X13_0g5421 [Tilletia indica]|uniref:Uncharacterized protein n=1 Tax=Tilletia indica TaxID=43049 RepID=A0A177TP79_9BASI|nr:hypothetical protein A4X13_0g5421 [Tilletia indica]